MDLFTSAALGCLITVAGVIVLLFYLPGLFCGKFKDAHDIIAGLMLHLTERKWVSVWVWFWVWVGLALAIGVLSPLIVDNDALKEWFVEPHGFLITLNYTLVVPLLLWAYLELSREARRFFQSKNLCDLGLSFKKRLRERWLFQPLRRNILSNLVLFVVICIITVLAVSGLKPPWQVFVEAHGPLYYSVVRAFNAYLAGGLILLVLGLLYVFYFGLDHSGIDHFLVDNKVINFELKSSIRQLVKRLSLCLFLGPLVVGIHGWALFKEGTLILSLKDILAQPIALVWMAWAIVMTICALCLLYGIWKLNSSVKETVAKKMSDQVECLWKKQEPSLNSYKTKIEALTNINAYVRSGGKVSGMREAMLVVGVPLFVQVLSFIITSLFVRQNN
ncbi:MAG: hypothetical protein OXF47_05580 [Nitrospira sp.]|nr:hypothetical protein [Nitrospira sp.]